MEGIFTCPAFPYAKRKKCSMLESLSTRREWSAQNSCPPAPSVIIIEDEDDLRIDLAESFVNAGWEVTTAANGREALLKLSSGHIDVWIIDLQLSDMDGFLLLQRVVSQEPRPGSIILTASIDDSVLVESFRRGCDIFLNKSASLRAIHAAAENLYHRQTKVAYGPDWILRGRELHCRISGHSARLTPSERIIVATLGRSPQQPVSKDVLLKALNRPFAGKLNLEVFISRLRRKLEASFKEPPEIIPVYGVGYMLDCSVQS